MTPSVLAITAITFDCFGTLIDWEAGILRALRPILSVHGVRAGDAELLTLYAQAEAELERGPYMPYRDVLAGVADHIAEHFGIALEDRERDRLADSVARWEPFADSPAALRRLATQHALVICSNIDDDLLVAPVGKLEHREETPLFERLVTAQYCRSYKPDPRHFRVALALLGLQPGQVLHVAQSKYHDLAIARSLGMATCWVNRPSVLEGRGVTLPAEAEPDMTVASLSELAARLEC